MTTEQARWRALVLLAVGGALGVTAGAVVALHNSARVRTLPADAIAIVNERSISKEDYARAVALLAGDKRTEVTDEDRAHILNRLIDEELLVQSGIEGGLVDTDRAVRKAITQAMLAAITAETFGAPPAEDELRVFYEANASSFSGAPVTNRSPIMNEQPKEQAPPFEEIRDQVEAAYLRHTRDKALGEYVEWLRSEARIGLAPEFLPSPPVGDNQAEK